MKGKIYVRCEKCGRVHFNRYFESVRGDRLVVNGLCELCNPESMFLGLVPQK